MQPILKYKRPKKAKSKPITVRMVSSRLFSGWSVESRMQEQKIRKSPRPIQDSKNVNCLKNSVHSLSWRTIITPKPQKNIRDIKAGKVEGAHGPLSIINKWTNELRPPINPVSKFNNEQNLRKPFFRSSSSDMSIESNGGGLNQSDLLLEFPLIFEPSEREIAVLNYFL